MPPFLSNRWARLPLSVSVRHCRRVVRNISHPRSPPSYGDLGRSGGASCGHALWRSRLGLWSSRRSLTSHFSPTWITHFRIDRTQQASRGGLITQCLFRCAKLILRCFDVFNAWKFVQIVQPKPKPCLDNTFSQYGIIHCPVEAQFLSPPQASGSVWLPAPFYIAAQVWHLERQEGKILWA